MERIARAIADSGPDSSIRVYPGLEHMLNVLPTDLTGLTPEDAMYQYHRFRYGEGTWADLTAWLREGAHIRSSREDECACQEPAS